MELDIFKEDNLQKIYKATELLAKSGIVPHALKHKKEDIFSILVMGAEIGLPPMTSLNNIHVVQGRPTIGAALMVGLVRKRYPDALIDIELDEKNLIAKCTVGRHQNDKFPFTSIWCMGRAKEMGLAKKDNYLKQPLTMLKWRAVSEAIRTVFPDVVCGVHSREEFQDLNGNEINVMSDKEMLDTYHPIPPEEKSFGGLYRVQNAKYRGLQLKDISLVELEDYKEKLTNRLESQGRLKEWEDDVLSKITDYIDNYDAYQDILNEDS